MSFLKDDILLGSKTALQLYENYAKNLPIIDYHCHINQQDILDDRRFFDIAELWLGGDHYKWRLMRNCGVEERYITGDSSAREKFRAFAECLPRFIGNPIYIWCHLELKKYFGYSGEINSQTADYIFDMTAEKLKQPHMSARGIIETSNVEVICTTDDPIDNLAAHAALAEDAGLKTRVLPTFRPDKALNADSPHFAQYIDDLARASGHKISNVADLKAALVNRLDYFIQHGCLISDHALSSFIYSPCDERTAEEIFSKAYAGKSISADELEKFQTYMLTYLAMQYTQKNIVMQLHFSCLRNNNTQMFKVLGPDTGFDCMAGAGDPYKLSRLLDNLHSGNSLPKTVFYSLNAGDDKLINTVINCFQGGMRGKLQHGSAWWFNDTKHGMQSHMKTLAEYGVLGNFVGMLTDSRSFTSYVRHDYFRRLLCDFLGAQVENGEYPANPKYLKQLVEDICYNNIRSYMGIF